MKIKKYVRGNASMTAYKTAARVSLCNCNNIHDSYRNILRRRVHLAARERNVRAHDTVGVFSKKKNFQHIGLINKKKFNNGPIQIVFLFRLFANVENRIDRPIGQFHTISVNYTRDPTIRFSVCSGRLVKTKDSTRRQPD